MTHPVLAARSPFICRALLCAGIALSTAAPLWAAAIVGALASLVATATRMAVRDLPGGRRAGMAAVTASAGLLAAGLVTCAMARLLLG